MKTLLETISDAVNALVKSYASELDQEATDEILYNALIAMVWGIAAETGNSWRDIRPTILKLLNSKETYAGHSEEFIRKMQAWGSEANE